MRPASLRGSEINIIVIVIVILIVIVIVITERRGGSRSWRPRERDSFDERGEEDCREKTHHSINVRY